MKTIDQASFKDKKVLIRVDYNVPLDDKLQVTDTTRIERTVNTVKKITNDGGIAILMSHLGRPKGKPVDTMSLKHIVGKVSEIMGQEVHFLGDALDADVEKKANALKPGDIALLENLRFHEEEEKGNENFAKQLARLGDLYVNDAFGTAHRAHASTAIIVKFFPGKSYAGYLLYEEVSNLNKALKDCRRPFTAIVGGAKISSKIAILDNLMDKVDNLIISGAMRFTFFKAFGEEVGNSIYEAEMVETAKEIVKKATLKGVTLYLSSDNICAKEFAPDSEMELHDGNAIPDGMMGLDIGPRTTQRLAEIILGSETILWNGPAGVFEFDRFAYGTKAMASCVTAATLKGAYSLVGGGDTITALNKFGLSELVSYISTGGGAMLEYMEGKVLPGIDALEKDN